MVYMFRRFLVLGDLLRSYRTEQRLKLKISGSLLTGHGEVYSEKLIIS